MPAANEDVHRLRDILVEEVSLVDRAANKRRFLLVKREGDMSELRPDGRGGFTRVRKSDDDAEDEDTAKAKAKKPFPGAAKPFGAKKPAAAAAAGDDDDGDDDEAEAKRKAAADDDEDEDTAKAKKKKPFPGAAKPFGAKPDDDEDEAKRKAADPEDVDDDEDKRKAAKATNANMSSKVNAIVEDLQELADELDEAEDDEPSDKGMKKLLSAHRKLGGMADVYLKRAAKKSILVAKIGRKMSASRLATYKDALETLQSLLAELIDSPKKDKDHLPDPGDPQLAVPGWKPSNPSAAPTNATGAAAIKASIEKVLGEFSGVLQSQASKIARLEKGVTPSNALTVDGVRKSTSSVVWPIDLNARPRDKVNKDVSFYDDD